MLAALVAALTLIKPPIIELVDGTKLPLDSHPATVIVFLSHDCPIANDSQPDLERIYQKHKAKNVAFVGIYIDPRLTSETVAKHKTDYRFAYSQSIDRNHALVKYLKPKVTPEAFVLDSSGQTLYRGRINNMYSDLGARRKTITKHDLDDAIAAVLGGKKPDPAHTPAHGCIIPELADFDGLAH